VAAGVAAGDVVEAGGLVTAAASGRSGGGLGGSLGDAVGEQIHSP